MTNVDRQYIIPVSNGLLQDGHCQRMGSAIWTFLWLIDRTTRELELDGEKWGFVLGGKPIMAQEIADILHLSLRTVKTHINLLRAEGYIRTHRKRYGLVVQVAKSKKRSANLCTSEKREVKKPAPLEGSEVQKNDVRSATKRTSRSEETCTSLLKEDNSTLGQYKDSIFVDTSDEVRLSKLLLDLILSRKPDFKKPNLQSWAKQIDLMIRVDHRDPPKIEAVIRWSQKDPFWQSNVLSTRGLRDKFDRLEMKMQRPHTRASPGLLKTKRQKGAIMSFKQDG